MSTSDTSRALPVPASRLARATRMGGLTTQLLGAMASGATRQLVRGERPRARDLLLTPANAQRLTRELARMRGAAMKMGQLISMESAEMLPPELAAILAKLRSEAHHMPPAQLKQVLIRNYGKDFLKRFKSFDVRPFAAASIGQVHKATTRDGTALALKVQYPGIRGAIDADIANLGSMMKLSGLIPKGLDLAPILEEARKQLHEEADYPREAAQLTRMADRLDGAAGFALPRPHADLSTQDILAMDFMPGAPIETLESASQETRDRVTTRLFRLFLHEVFDWHHVQTDPNFANFLYDAAEDRIVLLDFGAARDIRQDTADILRAVLIACAQGDHAAMRDALTRSGYISPRTTASQVETLLAMTDMIQGPLTQTAPYDFGDTRQLDKLRDAGMVLGSEQGYVEIPDMDTLFVQRKLGGLVLLATRLQAQIPLAELMAPYLATSNPSDN